MVLILSPLSLGIDFVEEAIAQAQAKKDDLPPDIAGRLGFRVADALRPSLLEQTFGAVVDSGFYHLFDPEQGERFLDEVAQVLRVEGEARYHSEPLGSILLGYGAALSFLRVIPSLSERLRAASKTFWAAKNGSDLPGLVLQFLEWL